MESWSTIRYRLGELHCPLLENLEDRKIGADLSGLAGDLRYNLLEWLFLTYDRSFYTKFIASDQSDSGRVQRRILSLIEGLSLLAHMTGLCPVSDTSLITGEARFKVSHI